MRKLVFIFLFFPLLLNGQSTWYVSTTGNDGTGDGTVANPWLTLYKAVTTVPSLQGEEGDVIHINAGTYTETHKISLADGISIDGDNKYTTIVHLTYAGNCIELETAAGWGNTSYGNQYISNITFDGDYTGLVGIAVNYRSNVKIHDCIFLEFYNQAAFFVGEPSSAWTTDNPYVTDPGYAYQYIPFNDSYCTGNEFYNNTVTNCSHATSSPSGTKSVGIGTQNGVRIYNNTITCTGRTVAQEYNGWCIGFQDLGFNKNAKIYDNTLTAPHYGTSAQYDFAIELWFIMSGTEIYDNRIYGSIDLSNPLDYDALGYSARVYDNDIGWSSTPITLDVGIYIEAQAEYVQIYRNRIHHVARAIYIPRLNYTGSDRLFHINIYDNLMVDLGQSGTTYQSWGIHSEFSLIDQTENEYVYIQNNVIEAVSSLSNTMYGIQFPSVDEQSNVYIENNILLNWDNGAIQGAWARTTLDNIFIRNNLIYGCGYTNWTNFDANFTASLTNYTNVQISPADPLLNDDYSLQVGSPAESTGRYVAITTDYLERNWLTPPSIGAIERTSGVTIPTVTTNAVTSILETTATSGGNITSDGGASVTAKGVCWSTSANPTTADSKTTDGTGVGSYTSSITGLVGSTTYYVRAYATNSAGTAYGSQRTFITGSGGEGDIDISGLIKHLGIMIIHLGRIIYVE